MDKEKVTEKTEKLLGAVNVDEDANKCCFCIPIDIGVVLIGLMIIYDAVVGIQKVV